MYLFHNICHNYSDEDCRRILAQTTRAMGEESVVLLHEFVLRDRNAQRRASLIDWTMLMHAGGLERTHSHWSDLLRSVGLEMVKVWPPRNTDGKSVIEARRRV